MSIAQYVTALAWASVFGSMWRCWVLDKWMPYGFAVIVFSLIVALISGLVSMGEKK